MVEAMIVDACKRAAENGSGEWAKVALAVMELERAIGEADVDGIWRAVAAIRQECSKESGRSSVQDEIVRLVSVKASLVEKHARIEEKSGLTVSGREFVSFIAWIAHYLGEVAARHNDPSILRSFQTQLVQKGALPAPGHAGDAGLAS